MTYADAYILTQEMEPFLLDLATKANEVTHRAITRRINHETYNSSHTEVLQRNSYDPRSMQNCR